MENSDKVRLKLLETGTLDEMLHYAEVYDIPIPEVYLLDYSTVRLYLFYVFCAESDTLINDMVHNKFNVDIICGKCYLFTSKTSGFVLDTDDISTLYSLGYNEDFGIGEFMCRFKKGTVRVGLIDVHHGTFIVDGKVYSAVPLTEKNILRARRAHMFD